MEENAKNNHESKEEIYFHFVTDVFDDKRRSAMFKNIVIVVLFALLAGCIAALVYFGIYCQERLSENSNRSEQRMYDFISQYDLSSEIDLDTGTITESDNSGNINFNQSR